MEHKKVQSKFLPRVGYFKNVYDMTRLMSIQPDQCGRVIKLTNLPKYCFKALLLVLEHSKIEKIILAGCFSDPSDTLGVLLAIRKNDKLQKILLDMQDNIYDENCLKLVIDLISKRVVKSFEAFNSMTEEHTELLLENIVRYDAKLKIFNLSGAILSDKSLEYLEKLLEKARISEILRLSKCKGIAGTSLTSEDKKQLEMAWKSANKFLQRNVKIYWFEYVGYLDVDRHRKDRLQFWTIEGVSFNKKTGKTEKLLKYLVKDMSDQMWQVFKPGYKRKQQPIYHINAKQKQRIDAAEEKELSDLFETSVAVNRPNKKHEHFATHAGGERGRTYHSSKSSGDFKGFQKYRGRQNPFERQSYDEQPSWYTKAVPHGDPGEGGSTTQEKSYYYQRQQSPNVSVYSTTPSATQPTSFAFHGQYNPFVDMYGSPIATANSGTTFVNPAQQLQPASGQSSGHYNQSTAGANPAFFDPTQTIQPASTQSSEQCNQSFLDIYGSPIATANPGTRSVNPAQQLMPDHRTPQNTTFFSQSQPNYLAIRQDSFPRHMRTSPEDFVGQSFPYNQRLTSLAQRYPPPCRGNQHRVQPVWGFSPQQQGVPLPPRYQPPHQGNLSTESATSLRTLSPTHSATELSRFQFPRPRQSAVQQQQFGNPASSSATILQSGPPIQSATELSRFSRPPQSAAQLQQSGNLRHSTSSPSAAGIQIVHNIYYGVQAGSQTPGNENITFSQSQNQTCSANQQSPECNNPPYRGHPQHDATTVYAQPSADNENGR